MVELRAYIQLTKPRIVLLFALTGLASMLMEGSLRHEPLQLWMVVLGIVLTAGSANALNQYIDRDIDAVMERTKSKRPLPQGRITSRQALVFGIVTGLIATGLLYYYGSALAALLGVGTIAFYIGIYTMWLKRRTPYNIVIGGAAGATAPLIGWAAATGEISFGAFISFLIIFLWTPPHFWALALCLKDEYAKASVPMLPVVAGEEATRKQIFWYSVVLIPLTFVLFLIQDVGWVYLLFALPLGLEFLRRASQVMKKKDRSSAWKMFGYSIVYLLVLYVAMIIDAYSVPPVQAAEQVPVELQNIGIKEKLGNNVDLNLMFKNEEGKLVPLKSAFDGRRPVLLFLAYYNCPSLCGFFLNGALEGLKQLQWTAGKEFELVTISIDPREEYELASKKKATYVREYARAEAQHGWHFWVNDSTMAPESDTNVKKLAEQVGFGYRYNKADNQYAHAAAMMFLTPDGRVSRYLYGVEFKPKDMKLALMEATGGKIGNVMDRIMLFCYNYDPKTRKYSLYAMNLMRAGAGLTVLVLGTTLMGVRRRSRPEEEGLNSPDRST